MLERFRLGSLIALFVLELCLTTTARARASALQFTLKPGPHAVGFKSVNQYDHSRTFKPAFDIDGAPTVGERARPIQTVVWYPCLKPAKAEPMRYEEYVWLTANETEFVELTPAAKAGAVRGFAQALGAPPDRATAEMNTPTTAYRDAKAAEGKFPVVVYAPSLSAPAFENSVLCEYLASHGFVVVSSPCLGPHSRAMPITAEGLDAQTRDIRFLIGFARTIPEADSFRIAVMGFSWGGFSNVLAAMHDDRIQAAVSLDGTVRYAFHLVEKDPRANPDEFNRPLLYLAQGDAVLDRLPNLKKAAESSPVTRFKRSDVFFYTFQRLKHQNFAAHMIKMLERNAQAGESAQDVVNRNYELVCAHALNFLNAQLKNDETSRRFLDNTPEQNGIDAADVTKRVFRGRCSPKSVWDFAHLLREDGFDKISETHKRIKTGDPDFTLPETAVNQWGYELLGRGKTKEAIAVLRFNVELYPQSFNVHDGLGEAYLRNGDTELAIESYRKSLELNPNNANAAAALKRLGK